MLFEKLEIDLQKRKQIWVWIRLFFFFWPLKETIHQHWKHGNNLRRKLDKHLLLIFFSLFLDGSYLTFENWQSIKDKSDREVKELLESFGKKCKQQKVCDSDSATLKLSLRLGRYWDELHSWTVKQFSLFFRLSSSCSRKNTVHLVK